MHRRSNATGSEPRLRIFISARLAAWCRSSRARSREVEERAYERPRQAGQAEAHQEVATKGGSADQDTHLAYRAGLLGTGFLRARRGAAAAAGVVSSGRLPRAAGAAFPTARGPR